MCKPRGGLSVAGTCWAAFPTRLVYRQQRPGRFLRVPTPIMRGPHCQLERPCPLLICTPSSRIRQPSNLCSGLCGEVTGLTPSPGVELLLISSNPPTPTPHPHEGWVHGHAATRLDEGEGGQGGGLSPALPRAAREQCVSWTTTSSRPGPNVGVTDPLLLIKP